MKIVVILPHGREKQHQETSPQERETELPGFPAECMPWIGLLRVDVAEAYKHACGEIFDIFPRDAISKKEYPVEGGTWHKKGLRGMPQIIESPTPDEQRPGDG